MTVDGRVRRGGEVTAIHPAEIVTESETFPMSAVSAVTFQRFEIPRGRAGVILQDGTRLSGGILERGREKVRFYSVTAGLLDIPMTDLAGVFYEPADAWRQAEAAIPGLVTRSGEVIAARRVLWADAESVALLTEDGVRRFPAATVSRVWWSRASAGERVRLRNGDVINSPLQFQGKQIAYTLFGEERTLEWMALEQIVFSK